MPRGAVVCDGELCSTRDSVAACLEAVAAGIWSWLRRCRTPALSSPLFSSNKGRPLRLKLTAIALLVAGLCHQHASAALPCDADLDGSGVVNGIDLGMFLAQWAV